MIRNIKYSLLVYIGSRRLRVKRGSQIPHNYNVVLAQSSGFLKRDDTPFFLHITSILWPCQSMLLQGSLVQWSGSHQWGVWQLTIKSHLTRAPLKFLLIYKFLWTDNKQKFQVSVISISMLDYIPKFKVRWGKNQHKLNFTSVLWFLLQPPAEYLTLAPRLDSWQSSPAVAAFHKRIRFLKTYW